MKTIIVPASKEYAVKIGPGLLSTLGQETAQLVKGRLAAIVSDYNVWQFYGIQAEEALRSAGFSVISFLIEPGEESKNGQNYLSLLDFLAQHQLTRADCLVALGGGVVGDLTGFAAATYLRGISYIQVPTTLLAMVDSSVGGKTAIDLPAGKNLAGAFYQPSIVLCDIDTLDTLPSPIFNDGCAEIIKYGFLFDAPMLDQLYQQKQQFDREPIIARCIQLKRDIVAKDEYDTGCRQLLNFGHTLGHAIEKQSGYTVSHGQAVAIGMYITCRATAAKGLCSSELCADLQALLQIFGLPNSTSFPIDDLLPHILSDKKRQVDQITLVLPATIGCCQLKPIPIQALKSFFKAGM